MIEGAAVLLAGMVIGWWMERRRVNMTVRKLDRLPSRPLCSCGHAPSFHDPESRRCHAEKKRPATFDTIEKWVPCQCRRYDGPEPLPEFYAPEIDPS